jgi:hypothetical protein
MSSSKLSKIGENAFSKSEKINGELFTLTYGSLVATLVADAGGAGDPAAVCAAVERRLDAIGYGIGLRIIDEFLARSGAPRCGGFGDAVEIAAKVGFRMFLGVGASASPGPDDTVLLTLDENPLCEFVELPPHLEKLQYCAILPGILRGALEQVHFLTECSVDADPLHGSGGSTALRIKLIEIVEDAVPDSGDA